jgi:hypothetical protein
VVVRVNVLWNPSLLNLHAHCHPRLQFRRPIDDCLVPRGCQCLDSFAVANNRISDAIPSARKCARGQSQSRCPHVCAVVGHLTADAFLGIVLKRANEARNSVILILVTNAIDPYYKEVVNVMAQSRGSRYWFRYEQEHVSEPTSKVWSQVNGSAGIIFFRDRSTGILYPIRAFSDANVESLNAPIIAIDFCVGAFPFNGNVFSESLQRESYRKAKDGSHPKEKDEWHFAEVVKTSQDAANDAAKLKKMPLIANIQCDRNKEKAIFEQLFGVRSPNKSDETTHWVNTIKAIGHLPWMQKSCFLYLRDVHDQRGKSLRRSRKNRGFLSATAGTYYVAKVSQYCPDDTLLVLRDPKAPDALKTPIQIETSADHDQIAILEGKHTLDGRYDECQLTFKTETDAAGASTVIRISQSDGAVCPCPAETIASPATQPEDTASPASQLLAFVPTITTDIEINHAPWQKAVLLTGVLLLFGGFMLNVLVPDAKDGTSRDFGQSLKHFQIFTMLIAMGATLTTWLGKDFWASFFRRRRIFWTVVAFLGKHWLAITGTALMLYGCLMLSPKLSADIKCWLAWADWELSAFQLRYPKWPYWTILAFGAVLIVCYFVTVKRNKYFQREFE